MQLVFGREMGLVWYFVTMLYTVLVETKDCFCVLVRCFSVEEEVVVWCGN